MGSGWPLTGRAEELGLITRATGGSVGATGVIIAGAAGVGKTRLAREALALARGQGRICRWFVATSSAGRVPLGAFADVADHFGPDHLRRVQEVIDAVTRTSSPSPVVVGVDDAHLLDELSALVVHQLVHRRLATVVVTVRTGESAPDAITGLWKDELLTRLDLQPLSAHETAVLLGKVLAGDVESSSADRIWNYTRGNALYLRQLLADDLAAGRFRRTAGVWLWDGHAELSPTLAELVEKSIGRQPPLVTRVLDVLSVADPVELTVLADITSPDAVDEAETVGLITIDTDTSPAAARLVHPMFGEVRRARAGTLRLRHLRGRVALALRRLDPKPDLIQTVRHAMLVVDSDLDPDPRMLMDASLAALKLMDPEGAESLAARAVRAGGGRAAQSVHVTALVHCDRIDDALSMNSDLIRTASSERDWVLLTLRRASILTRIGKASDAAQQLVAIRDAVADCGLRRPYECVSALIDAMQGRPAAAVQAATVALSETGWLGDAFELLAVLGLVAGHGDLGQFDAIAEPVERGYELARTSLQAPTARFFQAVFQVDAFRVSGLLAEAQKVAERLAQEPADFPYALTCRVLLEGMIAWALGDLRSARRWLREAVATGAALESIWLSGIGHVALTTSVAMSGDYANAQAILAEEHPYSGSVRFADALTSARAWVCAAGGVISEAVTLVRDSAARAENGGRPAWEVLFLQTATQFGDPTGAARLTELTSIVQGPRVIAAARHAAALRDGDGPGLVDASRMYESFGDRIAAADAAAQAAAVFRERGYRGAALTATVVARRLAEVTGAATPALRANTTPLRLTSRQREIIALAAAGLSNRDIADRLVMSVRTVEGHIFRASQKTGTNSREELIALLEAGHGH